MNRPPLIYVAGASRDPERVRAAMNAVRALGGQITLDWLAVMEAESVPDAELGDDDRGSYASADLQAIRAADLVWVLASGVRSKGAWVELGYALAIPRAVIVSGPKAERTIFGSLAEEYDTDEEAIAAIRWRFGAWRPSPLRAAARAHLAQKHSRAYAERFGLPPSPLRSFATASEGEDR